MAARLAGWKGRLLSPGGRFILLKHVLASIPVCYFAAMEPPKSVIAQLETMFSRFLWGSEDASPRRTWRSYQRVAYPFAENGLGLRRLEDIIAAFSCKLW